MSIHCSEEVRRALAEGHPVVALETAVLTHGLPRENWGALTVRWPGVGAAPEGIDPDAPLHLAAARCMAAAVRASGATPAVTAVLDGLPCVGLDDAQLDQLASDGSARKLAARDLASAIADRASGGTTVSAALRLARAAGLRVFATGGIGGVHRAWQTQLDVSADLLSLAREPLVVVSSGAKSILDLPATVEALEALSVPVVGFGTDAFPRFITASDPALRVTMRVDSADAAARLAKEHWTLGGAGVLLANPVDPAVALDPSVADAPARNASKGAAPRGAAVTPVLLGHLVEATSGASLRANLVLLRANAALAARVARAIHAT
ncbi:MAG: pseudouridine-5'-phosphate glycosidase [Phycisphaeraceae bacterium]|nr:pseudouridine-5'-phosphate glycosidase [Phycisphaeraceae bacterium]